MSEFYKTRIKTDKDLAEGHVKHIDIHYITKGIEVIEVYTMDEVELVKEYNDENDYALYRPIKSGRKVVLRPFEFGIFYPEDLHMPGLAEDQAVEVEKVVLKIPYSK